MLHSVHCLALVERESHEFVLAEMFHYSVGSSAPNIRLRRFVPEKCMIQVRRGQGTQKLNEGCVLTTRISQLLCRPSVQFYSKLVEYLAQGQLVWMRDIRRVLLSKPTRSCNRKCFPDVSGLAK